MTPYRLLSGLGPISTLAVVAVLAFALYHACCFYGRVLDWWLRPASRILSSDGRPSPPRLAPSPDWLGAGAAAVADPRHSNVERVSEADARDVMRAYRQTSEPPYRVIGEPQERSIKITVH